MKRSFFKKLGIIASMITILLSAAWMTTDPARAGQAHMNYRLKWLFNASVVGDLYADVHGFFYSPGPGCHR